MAQRFHLEVSGDLASFTRPAMKVERVSYDVITPSTCSAIFETILWKPAIQWQPERVELLVPVRWTTQRRNEVTSKITLSTLPSFQTANNALARIGNRQGIVIPYSDEGLEIVNQLTVPFDLESE